MMRVLIRRFGFSLALGLLALSAQATETVDTYSNLASGPSLYDANRAYQGSPTTSVLARFVATTTGTFAGFRGAVNEIGPASPQMYDLGLYADAPGQVAGVPLAFYPATSTGVDAQTTTSALSTVTVANGPLLNAGTAYWVGFVSRGSFVRWNQNVTGATGRLLLGGYSTLTLPAFSVQVTPVPEPSALAALGLGAVFALRRRRR